MATDVTNPQYFLRDSSSARRARVLTGRGTVAPGYTLIGAGKSRPSESLQSVKIKKVVSPLTGQSSAAAGGGWRYANRGNNVRNVTRVRQSKSVAPGRQGTAKVIRPPKTALRRMSGHGQGTVSTY